MPTNGCGSAGHRVDSHDEAGDVTTRPSAVFNEEGKTIATSRGRRAVRSWSTAATATIAADHPVRSAARHSVSGSPVESPACSSTSERPACLYHVTNQVVALEDVSRRSARRVRVDRGPRGRQVDAMHPRALTALGRLAASWTTSARRRCRT
jgi:hypothetical protein